MSDLPAAATFDHLRLVSLRVRNDRTVADAAAAAGVSRQTWYQWEAGTVTPGADRLGPIATALGVTIADLFDRTV